MPLAIFIAISGLGFFSSVARAVPPGDALLVNNQGELSSAASSSVATPDLYPQQVEFIAEYGWFSSFSPCTSIGAGTAEITTPPAHGTITFSSAVTVGGCPGQPSVGASYTWTDTSSKLTTDSFSITWISPDKSGSLQLSFSVDLTTGTAKQVGQVCPGAQPSSNEQGSSAPVINNTGNIACGDPISPGIGNVHESMTDYATAGQNQLAFTRYYNSVPPPTTFAVSLGSHWRSNFDRYLNVGSSTVTAERSDGQQLTFTLNGGVWTSDTDVDYTLSNSGSTWTLTDHDDTVETYTQGGMVSNEALLNSITARNGYAQSLAYNANNQLVSVADSYKRSFIFAYNGVLLNTVTTPDGLVLTYGYNSSGLTPGVNDRLASVSFSTNPVTNQSYQYGDTTSVSYVDGTVRFCLTSITDENGNAFATFTYDQYCRGLTSQHGAGAALTTVSYDDTTGNRTVTNALGEQETFSFTTLQGVPKVSEIDRLASTSPAVTAATRLFTYDGNGYTASATDWNGNRTDYTNDAHGDPLVINEAVSTKQARTTTITYDTTFAGLPTQIVTQGLTTSYSYDSSGNPLTKTLADTTTQKKPYSTKGQTRTWTYTWSDFLLASAETPLKDVTQFSYDGTGALTEITNALGQKTEITEHLPGGLPETIIDPNGVVTNLAYDPRQRLLSSAVTTSAGVLTTAFAYDPAGNLITVTLPNGSALTDGYDTAHRLIRVTDLFNESIAYTLDALGDRTLTQVENSSSAVKQQHSGVFDALGRVLQDTGGVGQTTAYSYDSEGNALSITDPLTHVTQQSFDALNRLSQVTQPSPVGGTIVTTYDAHDRPLTVTDPNGNVTSYVYDGFGDVIDQVSPDSGTTLYYYDADGNLMKKENADKVVTTFTYDALDRVLTTRYPADSTENVAYAYDQSGHGSGIGRLTSLTDAAGTLSRSYDERGNILNETRQTQGQTLSTSYAYDVADRIAGIAYPSGARVAYSRDIMGRIKAISATPPGSSAATVLSGIDYEPFGPVTTQTFGNGIAETRSFDLDYRMTNLADAGTATLQNLTYGYDADDNVLSIANGITSSNSQALGYDVLDRLTSATGGYGSLAYAYDPVGNRLSQTLASVITKYTYVSKSNRLKEIVTGKSKQSVGSTAAGNIDSFKPALGPVTGLAYNKANRLETAKAKLVFHYTYDAFGQRLVKSAFDLTLFGYDLSGHLLEESTGTAITDYIYLDGRLVATLTPSAGAMAFLIDDRLGTPQLATDNSQSTIWNTNYQPYGLTGTINGSATQNLRLPGQYADAESGFNYNHFRDYVPGLGRYLESDPIGELGGLNTYAYVQNNPSVQTDTMGLACCGNFSDAYKRAGKVADGLEAVTSIGQSVWEFPKLWNKYGYFQTVLNKSTNAGGLFFNRLQAIIGGSFFNDFIFKEYQLDALQLQIAFKGGAVIGASIETIVCPFEDSLLDLPFVQNIFADLGLDYRPIPQIEFAPSAQTANEWFRDHQGPIPVISY